VGRSQFHDGGEVMAGRGFRISPTEQLAILRDGEHVVKSDVAQRNRGTLNAMNAGGDGAPIQIHIHTMDPKNMEGWMRSGGAKQILRGLSSYTREGRPLNVEANILNPTAGHALNPNYGFQIEESDPVVVQVSGGPLYQRDIDVRGRVYSLRWLNRPLADIMQLRQWARQYRDGFFTYYDIEQNRYFTGKFLNSLKITGGGNDAYSAQGIFVEIPNLAMSTYPSNWARDAIFWEQNDDNGNARTKQTGVWTPAVNANAHGARPTS
jgi:hypothetical protein